MSELAPARLRGRYTSWATTAAYAGFAVVPFIARGLVPTFAAGWRVLFGIGALGGIHDPVHAPLAAALAALAGEPGPD